MCTARDVRRLCWLEQYECIGLTTIGAQIAEALREWYGGGIRLLADLDCIEVFPHTRRRFTRPAHTHPVVIAELCRVMGVPVPPIRRPRCSDAYAHRWARIARERRERTAAIRAVLGRLSNELIDLVLELGYRDKMRAQVERQRLLRLLVGIGVGDVHESIRVEFGYFDDSKTGLGNWKSKLEDAEEWVASYECLADDDRQNLLRTHACLIRRYVRFDENWV